MANESKWETVVRIFNSVSTTSVRIFVTLAVVIWTAGDYIVTDDAPDINWLVFLAALAGVDMVQAAVKKRANVQAQNHEATAHTERTVKSLELEHKKLALNVAQNTEDEEPLTIEERKEIG